ncbi:MAG: carboxypeptidase-like regulatory domain-containing protein [Bacteroidota bacterium]
MVNSKRPQLKNKSLLIWGLLLVLLGTGCDKEYDIFVPDGDTTVEDIVLVSNSVYGTVQDNFGNPISGAIVTTKYGQTTTNEDGIFSFPNLFIRSDQGLIEVQHPDYFPVGRTFVADDDQLRIFHLTLQAKDLSGTFESQSGGEINFPGGAYLEFPANAFQDVEGSSYQGLVLVKAQILDPAEAAMSQKLPASLWSDKQEVLKPYAFIHFELVGIDGQSLFLEPGTGATLYLPKPGFLDVGESALDLWHYQAEEGIWQTEGTLDLSGDYIIMQEAFPGTWLCAQELTSVLLSGRLADEVGTAYPHLSMELVYAQGPIHSTFQSLVDGTFSLKVPSGEAMELHVLDNCGDVVYSLPLGPLSAATQLPTINLEQANFFPLVLEPVLRNCSGDAILEGYYQITIGEQVHTIFSNSGNWRTTLATCDASTFVVQGFDFSSDQMSAEEEWEIQPDLDLDEILICSGNDVFVNLTIDGEDYLGLHSLAYQTGDFTVIEDSLMSFRIAIEGLTAGSFPVSLTSFQMPGFPTGSSSEIQVNSTITYYGEVNDVIIGSFGGSFQDQEGVSHQVSGNYKATHQD